MSAGKKDDSWKGSFGTVHLAYFKGLKYQLGYQGFKDDEMLQEGLAEAIPSKTFKIRIVPKLTKGSYHQVVFEDGVAYLQVSTFSVYNMLLPHTHVGFIDRRR